jgi:hypothetical protein
VEKIRRWQLDQIQGFGLGERQSGCQEWSFRCSHSRTLLATCTDPSHNVSIEWCAVLSLAVVGSRHRGGNAQGDRQILSSYRKVAVLVISGTTNVLTVPSTITVGDHLFATSERDGQKHQHLVMHNASCCAEMPGSTLDKIRLAFSL